jgi:hypothetical protein
MSSLSQIFSQDVPDEDTNCLQILSPIPFKSLNKLLSKHLYINPHLSLSESS